MLSIFRVKIEAEWTSETQVSYNNIEDLDLDLCCCENVKSCKIMYVNEICMLFCMISNFLRKTMFDLSFV
jgi:DNA-directed RNA polymerase alpha subunit